MSLEVKSSDANQDAPKRIGDYLLLKQIGAGGMGVVYQGVQKYLNQIVAIKILPEQYAKERNAVTRFAREMILIGGLEHPNIVRALYAGVAEGSYYLVMEYLYGDTVLGLMQRAWERNELSRDFDYRIPPEAACEIVRQAARGLAYLHNLGMVHRDIKPANLMVQPNASVKLLDMGLGKFDISGIEAEQSDGEDEEAITRHGMVIGTSDFMPPEQWDDPLLVDRRTDIYALGCTLYFMLTGQILYGGANYDTVRRKMQGHKFDPIPSLHVSQEEISQEVENLFRKMVAKKPEERFQNANELITAVEPLADPISLAAFQSALLKTEPLDRSRLERSRTNRPRRENKEDSQRRHTFRKRAGPRRSSGTKYGTLRSRWSLIVLSFFIAVLLLGITIARLSSPNLEPETPGKMKSETVEMPRGS